jgi:hypothetical protein
MDKTIKQQPKPEEQQKDDPMQRVARVLEQCQDVDGVNVMALIEELLKKLQNQK